MKLSYTDVPPGKLNKYMAYGATPLKVRNTQHSSLKENFIYIQRKTLRTATERAACPALADNRGEVSYIDFRVQSSIVILKNVQPSNTNYFHRQFTRIFFPVHPFRNFTSLFLSFPH